MWLYFWVTMAAAGKVSTVVVTVVDDLGFGDVGYNNPDMITPTMNRLSANGVRLNQFYASPTCTASRAALLSGKHPMHLGLQDSIIHPSEPRGVPLDARLLSSKVPTTMKRVFIGKWHLGFCRRAYVPLRRGFDEFFGILVGGGDHYTHLSSSSFVTRGSKRATVMTGSNLWNDDLPAEDQEGVHTTELYTQKAIEALNRHDKSIFLVLAYQAVHAPIQAPPTPACGERAMCWMVKQLDDALKQIEATLLGRSWNSTLWFVLSDNGGILRHGSSNGDLRGEKGSYYEGGVRVPAFVSGGAVPRRSYDHLFHITDVHATILGMLGVVDKDIDGIDHTEALLWSSSSKPRAPREELVHNVNSELFGSAGALRVGDFKLVVEARVTESEIYEYGQHMLQDDNWDPSELSQVIHQKLLRTPGSTYLFNIHENPTESDDMNLFEDPRYRAVRDMMLAKWDELKNLSRPSTELWLDDGPLADPALFGGVWTPWRDDQNYPYATYELAQHSLHPNLGGASIPQPALLHSRRRLESSSTCSSPPTTMMMMMTTLVFVAGLLTGRRLFVN
ncbi:hypothetical protein CTAYLR_002591 [Chrysophaeum taylorii]|uniref:Sulfatase N-terminal domain-containing protein n=1 Tax=Chrysophaeum taylorii TaxID=2483200 RepID=A0AAD7UCZ7_9STRA|nr:hypothetical protein CTAYLR_002591 [Chrysophaeum taylorii]